jgi:hypothetical protein
MGLDKISLTLYDLVGYLLPGYVWLLACSIIEASFSRSSLFSLSHISRYPILATVIAYFLGQTSHAIGSWIKNKKYRWFSDHGNYALGPDIKKRVLEALKETYGIELDDDQKLSKIDRYLLADSYIVATGGSVERDILMAREGFYKASAVAFALLSLAVLLAIFVPVARIQTRPDTFIYPTKISLISLIFFLFFLVWLFRQRFIFFNCIKTNNALLTFLALRQMKITDKDRKV